ncbi:MAG TPA: SCO family protein [Solirubrobacteraceae bacterium]|jgi:protein SCO1/2
MRRPRPHVLLLAVAALLAATIALVAILDKPSDHGGTSPSTADLQTASSSGFDGAAIPPSPLAPAFTLTDQNGRSVSLSSVRGHVTVLAFLYSTCGATCVLIAQQIRGALDELPHPAPVLIVSANPAADTPASVARFLTQVSLAGRVRYLTGSPTQLRRVWRAYRVHPASDGRATFDRFASLLLLDARGRERVLFEPEVLTPEGLAHDIRRLQAET